ncbi:MAG: hypothetical protein CMI36_09730 [Owenweeksia sp.]|nr:hypothetical protein [Owenweeksia sp.]MBF99262.1 hypothetical protein [Owenweeksia sp.]HBF22098.1 hypothetical protein [Cryomorphaceae bacterium]HCQ15872.1 hypothetical protein [Cryomorphaceae bacterium]
MLNFFQYTCPSNLNKKIMRTKLLCFAMALFAMSSFTPAKASLATFSTYSYNSFPFPGSWSWSSSDFSACASGATTRDIRVQYDYCYPYVVPDCGPGGCGANPYTIKATLYRNGTEVASQEYQVSQAWANFYWYDFPMLPGTYSAVVQLRKRKDLCIGWKTVETLNAGVIVVNSTAATPNFNINGVAVPSDGSPISVCASNITMNASSTSCESKYYIGVQESDRWWSRTYDYEWGHWFSGTAPNGINIQQLATTYSYPPDFTGSAARQGSPLIGGNLPSGAERYYRVNLCTSEPTWACKTALIRVDGNCKTGAEDAVSITVIEESEVIDNLSVEAYPNPIKDQLTLNFKLPYDSRVVIGLYDLQGRKIRDFLDADYARGSHLILPEVGDLAEGTYMIVVNAGASTVTQRVVVSK